MPAAGQPPSSTPRSLSTGPFVGRAEELDQIRSFVDDARTGSSRLVVISGAAGTGKLERLRQCLSLLSGFQVLFATGDVPVPPGVPVEELGPELLRVVLEVTRRGPTALIVDDPRWIDQNSARVLRFVLRRSVTCPLLTLGTSRAGGQSADLAGDPSGLPAAEAWPRVVAGPPARGALQLADIALGQQARRMLRTPTGRRAIASRLRLAELPAHSRDLLDAVAVLNLRCRLALPAQVSGVPDAVAALEPLLETGLVQWWPSDPSSPVRVCDPTTRDLVYGLIGAQRRRALHRVAAALVDRSTSWGHRVAAATRPDPELADQLRLEAAAAAAVHEEHRAADLLLWAADLSGTRSAHERHLLTGMLHLLRCPDEWPRVERLMPSANACAPSASRHCVQGEFALGSGRVTRARVHLTEAIGMATPDQSWVLARAAGALAGSFLAQGRGGEAVRHADIALAQPDVDPGTASIARCGRVLGILYAQGPRAALSQLGEGPSVDVVLADPTLIACRSVCRLLAGNLVGGLADAVAADRRLRSNAVRAILVFARYLLGLWHDAWGVVETANTAPPASGQARHLLAPWHAVVSVLASGRGAFDGAERELEQVRLLQSASAGEHPVLSVVAEASLAQARGDYPAMVVACAPLVDHDSGTARDDEARTWQAFWRPLHVEGLIGVGDLDAAAGGLDQLALSCGDVPYLRATVVRLSGWLAQHRHAASQARAAYRQALSRPLGHNEIPLQRAHLEHAYGRLLVRAGNRRQAVNWLRRAQLRYFELGALPFANRCSDDLAQAGPRSAATRQTVVVQSLTRREREVSGLVARGMTNHEVATRLYVSRKTVEYHLSNVYAKLGIRSRRELRAQFRTAAPPR